MPLPHMHPTQPLHSGLPDQLSQSQLAPDDVYGHSGHAGHAGHAPLNGTLPPAALEQSPQFLGQGQPGPAQQTHAGMGHYQPPHSNDYYLPQTTAPSLTAPAPAELDQPEPEPELSASKRKSTDSDQQPQRAKRARYTTLACNECKRRKIKCNGQTPCQRCGHLNIPCLYTPNCCSNLKDSEDFKQLQDVVVKLQAQVAEANSALSTIQKHLASGTKPSSSGAVAQEEESSAVPPMEPVQPIPPHRHDSGATVATTTTTPKARFLGPTSSAFSLRVANSTLKTYDLCPSSTGDATDEGSVTKGQSPVDQFPGPDLPQDLNGLLDSKDPTWHLCLEEAIRLIRFWEEEIWMMFPLTDVNQILGHAQRLYSLFDLWSQNKLQNENKLLQAITDDQTKILKVILATALTLEGKGRTPLGILFSQHVERYVQEAVTSTADLRVICLLMAAALYFYHLYQDEENLAWRITGVAARFCFELGLHRQESYISMTSNVERAWSVKLMWSVYILDRRWTFGTGLPFAIQDADMDPNLLLPDKPPYLYAMVAYSKVGSKVWRWVSQWDDANTPSRPAEMDKLDELDGEILQWFKSLPGSLKADSSWELKDRGIASKRLRVLIRLRLNQMRIVIYRPIMHTPASIRDNLDRAKVVVDIAKRSVREITKLAHNADMYRSQQVLFNHFLLSAVAVLVLSVCHAPVRFASEVKDEFHMAVEFVRTFSADSVVARKLWKTLQSLKAVGQKLGVNFASSSSSSSSRHTPSANAAGKNACPATVAAAANANANANANTTATATATVAALMPAGPTPTSQAGSAVTTTTATATATATTTATTTPGRPDEPAGLSASSHAPSPHLASDAASVPLQTPLSTTSGGGVDGSPGGKLGPAPAGAVPVPAAVPGPAGLEGVSSAKGAEQLMGPFGPAPPAAVGPAFPSQSPNGMADDLAGLFQAAGGFAGLFDGGAAADEDAYVFTAATGQQPVSLPLQPLPDSFADPAAAGVALFGNDRELSDVLKGLF